MPWVIALDFNTTGIGNIALGFEAGSNVATANSVVCIGNPGADVSNSCYISQIFGATSSGGTAVFINCRWQTWHDDFLPAAWRVDEFLDKWAGESLTQPKGIPCSGL
jgi:hypothetical protein